MSLKSYKTLLMGFIFAPIAIIQIITTFILFNSNYIGIIILSFCFGYIFADIWEQTICNYLNLDGGQHIRKTHIHHSIYGLLAFVLTLPFLILNLPIAISIFFWGIGIIIQHTFREKRFVFITKD